MQPNIPQAPYVRYPSYNIKVPSIIDISLQKLMEHRMREAQYNAQQQAVASRTPTVLTDPLLNLRVRDYYRQKYQQTLETEIAGRVTGTLEGAAIGAGVAASLLALASTIMALIPGAQPLAATGFGAALSSVGTAVGVSATASATTAMMVGGAAIGAGVGAIGGLAASDYTTWYATRDMFANLWQQQSVGRGVLNTLSFVGQSMDLLGTSAVVKSSLYALINSKDIGEIIAQTYGLTEKGRTDMDFSMIRESLGLDLGGIGNFVFDMTGEMLSDLGNLAGITKGAWAKSSAKIYTKYVTDGVSQLVQSVDNIDGTVLKQIARLVRENKVDDLAVLLKTNKELSANLVKELGSSSLDELRPYLQKFADSINQSAIKNTTVKMADALSSIDFMDDTMTGILMRASNPGILAATAINRAPKIFGKLPISETSLKYFSKMQEFIFGNLAKSRTIARDVDSSLINKLVKNKQTKMAELYTSNTVSKQLFNDAIAKKYPNSENLQKLFKQYKIDDVVSLYKNKDKDPILEKVFTEIKKDIDTEYLGYTLKEQIILKKLNDLDAKYKKLKTENNAEFIKQKESLIEQYTKQHNEYLEFISNKDYEQIVNLRSIMNDPIGFSKARSNIGIIWTSNNIIKDRAFGKLNDFQKEKLNEAWKEIIEDYIKDPDNDHTIQALEMFSNSKNIRKMIDKYIDQDITNELSKLYADNLNQYTQKILKLKPEYYNRVNRYLLYYIKDTMDVSNISSDIKQQFELLLKSDEFINGTEQNKYNLLMKFLKENTDTIEAPKSIGTKNIDVFEKQIIEYNSSLNKLKKINWLFDKTKSAQQAYALTGQSLFEFYNPNKLKTQDPKIKIAKERDLFYNIISDMDSVDPVETTTGGRSYFNPKTPNKSIMTPSEAAEYSETEAWLQEFNQFLSPVYDTINAYYGLYAGSARASRLVMMRLKNILVMNDLLNNPDLFIKKLDITIKNIDDLTNKINEFLADYKLKSKLNALVLDSNELALKQLQEIKTMLVGLKDDVGNKGVKSLEKELISILEKNNSQQIELIEQMFKEVNRFNANDAINDRLNKALDSLRNKIIKAKKKGNDKYVKWGTEIYNYLTDSMDQMTKMSDIYKRLNNYIRSSDQDITALDILESQLGQFNFDFAKDAQQAYFNIRNIHSIFELANVEYNGVFRPYANAFKKFMLTFEDQDWTFDESTYLTKVISNANTTVQYLQQLRKFGFNSSDFNKLIEFKGLELNPKIKITDTGIKGKIANEIVKVKPEDLVNDRDGAIDKLRAVINDIKDKEEKLSKEDIEFINKVEKQIDDFNIDDEIDSLFPHYYNTDKITAVVHRSTKFKDFVNNPDKIKLDGISYITFDTETTGSTANGLYSLGYTIHRPGQAPIHKNILLNPKYGADKHWVFDAEVDALYKDGGGQKNWDKLYRDHITDKNWIIVNTEEDIIKLFKQDITDDDILIAFNASFDYDQLASKVLDGSGFDYTIFDAQKILTLTGIQNPNKPLTNVGAAKNTSDLFDTLEKYQMKSKATYYINGNTVSESEYNNYKTNKHVIRTEFDYDTGETISTFDGKELHEARNDVDLMNEFVNDAFKQLHEQNYTLKDLSSYYALKQDIYNRQIYNALNDLQYKINYIFDKLSNSQIPESGIYKYDTLIDAYNIMIDSKTSAKDRLSAYYRFKDSVNDILNNTPHKDYILNTNIKIDEITGEFLKTPDDVKKRREFYEDLLKNKIDVDQIGSTKLDQKAKEKLKDLLEKNIIPIKDDGLVSTTEFVSQTDYDLTFNDAQILDEFITDVDTQLMRQTNVAKQWNDIVQNESVAYLQVNKFKTNYLLQYQLSRPNNPLQRLLNLFNGNADGLLTGKLKDFSEVFKNYRDQDLEIFNEVSELNALLNQMIEGTTFINKLYQDTDPQMYDAIDNIIDMIVKDYNNNIDITDLKHITDYREFLAKRADYMGFDLVAAYDTLDTIINNIDKFTVINSTSINKAYQLTNKSLLGLISHVEWGIKNKQFSYSPKISVLLTDLKAEIKDDFSEMRYILSDTKAQNHLLQQEQFTLTELNQMSQLKESEFVDGVYKNAKYKFVSRGSDIQFDQGVHTMLPAEAVANRAGEVIRYTSDFNKQDKLRKKANSIFADLYKEQDGYKALPITGVDNNRLFSIIRLGGQAINVNMYNLINNVTGLDQFKDFTNAYKREQLLELFDYIDLDIRNKDELTQQKWLQFRSQLENINDLSYPYIKDTKELQERIKCIIAYNYQKTNLYNVKFDGSNVKIVNSIRNVKDGMYKDAYDASSSVFDTIKALYTHTDGTFDLDGFRKWLDEHPEYVLCQTDTANNKLIRLNHYGKIKLSDGQIQDTLNEVLNDDSGLYNLLSRDTYIGLTNEIQHIMLPDKVSRFLRRSLLGPLKMWSLFNFNFLFQNATAAAINTTVSTSGKINFPRTIFGWIKTARDINKYTDLYNQILNSNTCIDLLSGSVDNYINNWLDLLDNKDLTTKLIQNGETELADILSKLDPDTIKMYRNLHDYMMSTSAFGEINSILNATKQSKEIRKRAEKFIDDFRKDDRLNKYVDTLLNTNKGITKAQLKADGFTNEQIEDILDKVLIIKQNKYQMMSKKVIKELLDAYEARDYSTLTRHEKHDKFVLQQIYYKKESDFSEKFSKYNILKKWLNVNEEMETVIRVSALRQYMEDGLTFDEATNEVIKRQFIYNNKSMAEQYAEFIVPFISYPIRMIGLIDTLASDAVTMDLLYRFNKYSWGNEDATRSDYLMRRKARGDIPVGNKLLQLTSPIQEGIMNLQNPLYTLNNKINPIAKPFIDLATGVESEKNRWNQLPIISNVNNLYHAINEGNILHNITSDYYRYSSFGNYYLPRVNNKIHGTLYNRMYTRTGRSRILMNMQPLDSSNLKYRVNSIMKYGGPYRADPRNTYR